MRKFITIILLMIASCYCYAQTSVNSVNIYYPAGSTEGNCIYSLIATRSSSSATTCSIKCGIKPKEGIQTSLEIPSTVMFGNTECTVTEISSNAFQNIKNFVGTLILPNKLEEIGQKAFEGCSGFTGNLVLPITLNNIGNKAFSGCIGITCITIPLAKYHQNAGAGLDKINTVILLTDKDNITGTMRDIIDRCLKSGTVIQPGDSNTNVSPVTFAPAGGSYTSSQEVILNCDTQGAEIYYTTNGSDPIEIENENRIPYKAGDAISVNTTTTIKTIAYKGNYANTSQATYTIIKTVETPTLSHKSGDYNNDIEIEISCATEGSKIYYTTDGTEPTSSSNEYTSPIDVNKNTNIKAVAYKDGLYSAIAESMYSFHTATPEFSQRTTSFNGNLEISLNCTTVGATIYYTTDGTEPTTSSKRYIEPISISETTTVKAFAVKEGYENSTVATAAYTKTRPVLTPTLSPASGTFSGSISVTISGEEGATIYYTIDGTEPTKESALYKESIILSEPTSIKAIADKTGMTESQVATGTYNFYLPAPTFSVVSGTYNTVQNVEINCTAEGAKIYYTTDGTEPTSSSTEYTTAVTIDKTKTIKAIAVKEGWENSSIVEAEYTLKVPAITYTPDPSNQFDESATVTLTCNGATIYYTIDSTDPTNESTPYTNSITVTKTTNIKAIAVRDGWEDSDMIDLWYKKFITVGEPVFNPDNNQALLETTAIEITCTVPNQEDQVYTPTIYYTLDGTTPTTESIKYTGPITISGPTTIKAFGMVNDYDNIANSPVISKRYDFKVAQPTITAGGSFTTSPQTVTIGCTTEGASIYYTTDGSNPTTSTTGKTIASGSTIDIKENTTVKAIAVKEEWISSDAVEATYEFNVECPSITPSCTFEHGKSITINLSCNTNGSTIHYTTDGSDPTPESAICNGKITLNETKTIKAIACKEGWNSSQIVSATYTEKEIVHTPVLSLLPGSYTSTQNNAITCTTEGATIYYTTDGTEPTTSSKTITSGNTIEITQTTTVKAFAYKEGMTKSSIISETYTFEVIEPTFNKTNGLYEEAQTIEISCATEGAKIYYTTDGSEPNDNSTPYNGPIEIEKTTTIKAIAYKDGWNPSHITTASYAFLETVATPTFSHSSGDYKETINVVIYCETPNAIIRYTMDGSTPDIHNTIYNGESIEVSETTTVKAVAFKDGMKTSEIAVATYTYSSNTTNALLVFTGSNPNNPNKWYDPLNWDTGTIPSKNDRVLIVGDLVISSDEKIEIEYITNLKSSFYTKQGSITIKDGGQVIYNQSALENVKIEKEITGYGDNINDKTNWYLISTPIADNISNNYTNLITGNDVNVNGTPDYDLYLYDEATHYWINYKDNKFTNLSLGHGYLYANRNNVTITSVGIPNANDVYFILSASCPNTSDEPVLHDIDMKGFNLIGNPFTFNIGKGTNQAISNTYLESGYYTLSTTDGTWVPAQDSRPIGVGEGILVETANNGNNDAILTISKTPYATTSKTRGASEETESLSIKVVNENYEDIAYVNFNNEKRGLRKIAHMNEDAQMVYVPANGVNYAIANMNTDVKEIPVSFEASTMGKYTISIDASKCNFEEIYLRDNFTGETVDIIYEDYAFVATSSDKAERFTLLITNNNANEDSDIINQNFAYIHNGEIIISDVEGSGNVYVYDIMGRPVLTRHANGNVNIPTSSLTGGIYIISLIDDNGIKTQKIAINK